MSDIIAAKMMADYNDSFVVFNVGMRLNKPLALRRWGWIASSFPKLLEVLEENPQKGFLGGETFFSFFPLTTLLVSYWRTPEDLERFARSKDEPHLELWKRFFREGGTDGSVGVYHETFLVERGQFETDYANMPPFGFGKATTLVPKGANGLPRHAHTTPDSSMPPQAMTVPALPESYVK